MHGADRSLQTPLLPEFTCSKVLRPGVIDKSGSFQALPWSVRPPDNASQPGTWHPDFSRRLLLQCLATKHILTLPLSLSPTRAYAQRSRIKAISNGERRRYFRHFYCVSAPMLLFICLFFLGYSSLFPGRRLTFRSHCNNDGGWITKHNIVITWYFFCSDGCCEQ